MSKPHQNPTAEHELVITRLIDAPREKVYRCWTNPELLQQWFAPKPFTVSKVEQELRPGGRSTVTMRSPDGQEFPNPGIYLEVVPNERIVFTDAFSPGFIASRRAVYGGRSHVRRRRRQDTLHRQSLALERSHQGAPRGDGLPHRLGPMRRTARGLGQDAVITG
ncbi:MAG: hypothetical protein RL701_1453 [Pseudomonadota bacterium]